MLKYLRRHCLHQVVVALAEVGAVHGPENHPRALRWHSSLQATRAVVHTVRVGFDVLSKIFFEI